jgi:hypothetical protein
MDGIWNRYNLKSTGRIYTFGVLKCYGYVAACCHITRTARKGFLKSLIYKCTKSKTLNFPEHFKAPNV